SVRARRESGAQPRGYTAHDGRAGEPSIGARGWIRARAASTRARARDDGAEDPGVRGGVWRRPARRASCRRRPGRARLPDPGPAAGGRTSVMKKLALSIGAAVVLAIAACIDMSAPNNGVASISTLLLPSPSVVIGDVMRDSTGVPAPLAVTPFDQAGKALTGF